VTILGDRQTSKERASALLLAARNPGKRKKKGDHEGAIQKSSRGKKLLSTRCGPYDLVMERKEGSESPKIERQSRRRRRMALGNGSQGVRPK